MRTTRIRKAALTLAASALVASGALTGCSITRDEEPEPSTVEAPRPTPTPTPSEEPTQEPTPSAVVSPSATAAPPAPSNPDRTPREALLSAGEMPQFNEVSRWTERRTRPAGTRAFGLCQKFDLLTIGAESAVERTFTSGGDTAAQQVAVFPDAQNTTRATKVVQAWHRDCASRVKDKGNVKVRPITDVPIARGKAWWYLVSSERNDVGHFHSLGAVQSGNRLTLIRMDHDGQDHIYDAGMDPMELAVKAAAAKLG